MGEWVKIGSQDIANIYIKNQTQNGQLYLGLYSNVIDPTWNLNDADWTYIVEPIASTYARVTMDPVNWVVAGEVSTYPQIDYDVSLEPMGTIYGCFIATSLDNSGIILAINQFATPAVLNYYGDRLGIIPRITIT